MRRAKPDEANEKMTPMLAATLSRKDVQRFFPVHFDEMDSFSAAEPSEGALVKLKSAPFAFVVWGTTTRRLTVSLPEKTDASKVIPALLAEVHLPSEKVTWRLDKGVSTPLQVTLGGVMHAKSTSRLVPGYYLKAAKRKLIKAARRRVLKRAG